MHALLLAIVAELLAVPAPPPGEYGNMVTVLTSAATQPADDAPLPRLVAFWSINRHNERLEPSQKVSERLVDAIEKHPDALSDLLAYLPAREEVCARVKKARSQPDSVSVWVLHHCASERDALFAAAASAKDKETWVEHGDDVQALARADWNRAKPLLEHFAGSAQPRLRALALSQLSIFEPNGRHRAELQSIAMDPNAPGYARDLAFDALSRDVWEGRDEWLLARMNDASVLKMRDGYRLYTPFDAIVTRDPDQWIPIMTRLVSDPDRNVRSIAANALAQFQPQHARADALRPLIPWISDPSFAEETSIGRLRLIQSVHSVGLTEAIPHLLYALTNDRDHVYRAYAAEALAEFHETRANALIREMLQTVQTAYMRDILIKALVVNDGASAREMAEAAEVFIAHPSEEPTLGKYVVEHVRDRDDVAQLLLARADALQTTNAERAAALRSTVMQWPVPSSDALLVRRIEEETADVPTILAALLRRESLRASHPDALRRLNSLRGTRAGIAAILLGDARNEQRILLSDDIDAQCALLSAARLVPEPLPIAMVAALFGRTQELDEAAEAWLIGNDSAEARAIVQRRHPNELLILGYGGFEEWEQDVLRAFKSSKDDEVIALGMAGVMPATTALTIHIRNGKATLVSERRRIALGLNVARELQSFDDLGPLENGTTDAIIYEYLHLTRRSARRIVMNAPASTAESPHAELVRTLLALIE